MTDTGVEQLSLSRLMMLRPSDIGRIRASMPKHAMEVAAAFVEQLLEIKKPSAADIDDVIRVSLQLKLAGVWEVPGTVSHVMANKSLLHEDILHTFTDTLDLELNDEIEASSNIGSDSLNIDLVYDIINHSSTFNELFSKIYGSDRGHFGKGKVVWREVSSSRKLMRDFQKVKLNYQQLTDDEISAIHFGYIVGVGPARVKIWSDHVLKSISIERFKTKRPDESEMVVFQPRSARMNLQKKLN
jgi:hypothetical protein